MAMGLFCFVSGVIADHCMDAREQKQCNALVSFTLEGEASANLKAVLVTQSMCHMALNMFQEDFLTSFEAANKNT